MVKLILSIVQQKRTFNMPSYKVWKWTISSRCSHVLHMWQGSHTREFYLVPHSLQNAKWIRELNPSPSPYLPIDHARCFLNTSGKKRIRRIEKSRLFLDPGHAYHLSSWPNSSLNCALEPTLFMQFTSWLLEPSNSLNCITNFHQNF